MAGNQALVEAVEADSPAQAEESGVQWEALSDESTLGADEDEASEVAAGDGEGEAEAGEEPPTTEAAPDAEPPASETEVAEVVEEAAPEEVPVPSLTPEQMAEQSRQWQEYQARQEEQLIEFYAMDEESALALATEPETVLPKLAARLHMEVLKQARAQLAQEIPALLTNVTQANTREASAKGEFFKAWPELKGKEQQVLQAGAMFRQLNPTATPQEAIQGIGNMVMAAMGKTPARKEPPAAPAPAAPFRPASGVGATAVRGGTKTAWEELAEDDY